MDLRTPAIKAFGGWKNNAELIADCARLGYLRKEWLTLDPTFGKGKFWTLWQPDVLVTSDLDRERSLVNHDFRSMPWPDDEFDAVVLDPPYKLNGTPSDKPVDTDYGIVDYLPWQEKHQAIRDGITECLRVLRPGGVLLVKCQDQVCSGQVRWQTREFADHAEALGCRVEDMLHIENYRAQPPGRAQLHARRNYSTMLVLVKK